DLRERRALVVIDACELDRDDIQDLVGSLPGCAVLVASSEQVIWEGTPCFVKGLAGDDALTLLRRELPGSLSDPEPDAARKICSLLDGNPLRIKQVVAPVREGRATLQDVANALASASTPDNEAMRIALSAANERERRLLEVVAALDGASISDDHLAAITGL